MKNLKKLNLKQENVDRHQLALDGAKLDDHFDMLRNVEHDISLDTVKILDSQESDRSNLVGKRKTKVEI